MSSPDCNSSATRWSWKRTATPWWRMRYDPDLTARGLEAALRTIDERSGKRPDINTGDGYGGY